MKQLIIALGLVLACAGPAVAQTTWGPESINTAGGVGDDGFNENGGWTGSAVYVGNNSPNSLEGGMRWIGVDVPQGATITSANLRMIARNLTGTITDVHGKVRGHKGDAPPFSDGVFDPNSGWTSTTAGVDFDPATFVGDVTLYDVDITTVVQEIVSGTWATGDDMALALFDDSSVAGNFLRVWDYGDGDSSKLTITYTTGGGSGGCRQITLLGVGGSCAN